MSVTVEVLRPRLLAAVRRTVPPRDIGTAFRPALDAVWAFLRANPGLRTDGHNVFLYHHVPDPAAGLPIDFGVEVTRRFEPHGEVRCVETPAGEAAIALHRGPYHELAAAHAAVHRWCTEHGRRIGTHSLEVYGDWHDDPDALETTVQYLLAT